MKINYAQLINTLLQDLSDRSREVVERRFGLTGPERETLEKVGKDFGITRERVRQIQEKAIKYIKESKTDSLTPAFSEFKNSLVSHGGISREDIILDELGGADYNNHAFFLLNLGEDFQRITENKDLHTVWVLETEAFEQTKQHIAKFIKHLKSKKDLVFLNDYKAETPFNFENILGVSKIVASNPDNKYGLAVWPEVNPKNIKDKAYLILKKSEKPLHFSNIYSSINNEEDSRDVLLQSVHNELIRNPEFILIGRGIYALKEWGYKPGWVKDILIDTIKESKKSCTKNILVDAVLKQRQVKESTILLNLSDKKCFNKDSKGNYTLKC